MAFLVLLFSVASAFTLEGVFEPRQLHISWGNLPTSMFVTWSAELPTPYPSIQYSKIQSPELQPIENYDFHTRAEWRDFKNSETPFVPSRILYYASGELTNLERGQYYQYRVGSEATGWSNPRYFSAKREYHPSEPVKFIVYGDLGVGDQVVNTTASVLKDLETLEYEGVIHVGDMAYDLDTNSGTRGDLFLETIEEIAGTYPYMVTQGNHEAAHVLNPRQFEIRFKMPGDSKNLWYSFTAGNAYFLAFTAEALIQNHTQAQADLIDFLVKEMNSIDRSYYTWVIGLVHRPMYCSANMTAELFEGEIFTGRHNRDCLESAPAVREAFEELFYRYDVDLMLNGHVHAYERLGPAYQNTSMGCAQETENLCVNANSPITIISGNPGQDESYAPPSPTPLPWSIVQSGEIGYGRLTIHNKTHLYWEQVRSIDRTTVDYLWLVKD